ncbi:MAG: tetratricopeptide repeat protein [Treponema sp.]|jgi:tetratricopeptide (TPR) repeat protein|nr:tetratricopeptide repeat protein [Treponema sp.]
MHTQTGVIRNITAFAAAFVAALIFLGCAGAPEPLEDGAELSPEAEELVYEGIRRHDRGDYKTALDYYRRALELSPDAPVIYYEMGFSYLYMENPEKTLEVSEAGIVKAERAVKNRDTANKIGNAEHIKVLTGLYELKGSALDNLGRREEAAAVYLETIERFGVSDTSLLYYNLGVTYFRMGKRAEARESLAKGLLINPFHPGSNYLLGRICFEENRKTQSLYSLCYFLILEPDTERSGEADALIKELLAYKESIGFSDTGAFAGADLIISLSFAAGEDKKTEAERFEAKLRYIFSALEEQKNNGNIERTNGDELWWDFYVPLFYQMSQSEYMEAFCRYISQSGSAESRNWLKAHNGEVEALFAWLNGR